MKNSSESPISSPFVTDRRSFLRIIGGIGFASAVAPGYILGVMPKRSDGILLEASAFKNPGGWKLDTQHYQQMGGSYLLAHGMGKPVENATTSVKIPEPGLWHVWVRNRDWCPGNWESPGRFKVHVNGEPLKPTFGAAQEAWHWQDGGTVKIEAKGTVEIALQDLTGFDGRCDAIFLTREEAPALPNDDLVALSAWKDQLSGRAGKTIPEESFDLVIVGGGISGCAAALAARSQGLSVALIQDRPLFGGNASQEVRVHTIGIYGRGEELLETICTDHYPNGDARAKDDQMKRERTMAASGVNLFASHIACGLEKDGDAIASVEAREVRTGLLKRFRAQTFIDATGDGWLGLWGGAECRYGRESHREFQEKWDLHGELWSPEKPDNKVMGTSVLWNGEETTERQGFPEVPWAKPVARNHEATTGEWYWEYSADELNQIEDAEKIRDHVLRGIYGSFANAKKHRKNDTLRLKWVSFVGGKRESRRIMGDYIYTMKDMVETRDFRDAVVVEKRDIDVHYQKIETGFEVDFISKALFLNPGGHYHVPFRCLYSKDISNMMMAGRCFSCSHIGLGGPRVMKTCGQMGIATGLAAALCKKYKATPRTVGNAHISELRTMIGYDRIEIANK